MPGREFGRCLHQTWVGEEREPGQTEREANRPRCQVGGPSGARHLLRECRLHKGVEARLSSPHLHNTRFDERSVVRVKALSVLQPEGAEGALNRQDVAAAISEEPRHHRVERCHLCQRRQMN